MNNFINQFQAFMSNPAQMLSRMGLPGNALQDPRGAVQMLMNSGRMNQQQFDALAARAQQIQNNPLFAQLFTKR